MRLAIVIASGETEVIANAFRFAAFSLAAGDAVTVFLMNAAVEIERRTDPEFAITTKCGAFLHEGGEVLACGTCLERRGLGTSDRYEISNLKGLRDLVAACDRVLTF
jgi:tRNA 2-thiouridine synthesizing protein D